MGSLCLHLFGANSILVNFGLLFLFIWHVLRGCLVLFWVVSFDQVWLSGMVSIGLFFWVM